MDNKLNIVLYVKGEAEVRVMAATQPSSPNGASELLEDMSAIGAPLLEAPVEVENEVADAPAQEPAPVETLPTNW